MKGTISERSKSIARRSTPFGIHICVEFGFANEKSVLQFDHKNFELRHIYAILGGLSEPGIAFEVEASLNRSQFVSLVDTKRDSPLLG